MDEQEGILELTFYLHGVNRLSSAVSEEDKGVGLWVLGLMVESIRRLCQ